MSWLKKVYKKIKKPTEWIEIPIHKATETIRKITPAEKKKEEE